MKTEVTFIATFLLILGLWTYCPVMILGEEPTAIDWNDPEVVAYMTPDVLCPFNVEVYPSTFSPGDFVFLKIQYNNTLDEPAYAYVDESAANAVNGFFLEVFFEDEDGCCSPVRYEVKKYGKLEGLWKLVPPGQGLTRFFPLGSFLSVSSTFSESLDNRLASGESVSGMIGVRIGYYSTKSRRFRMNFSKPITLVPRSKEERIARTNVVELLDAVRKGPRNVAQRDRLQDAVAEYVQKYPTDENKLFAQFASFGLVDLHETAQADVFPGVDALKGALDAVADKTFRDGFRAYFRGLYFSCSPELSEYAGKQLEGPRKVVRLLPGDLAERVR